ncbi:three component ABC system middle component [Neobacillus mesonae]|uniref:three component ABC system middle component n=1 Tax=Neobacillus mesonae TaxID=1193713 RepID=UPI0025736F76|nr:three component ABC system middle component [Neobacillus mesonae]
MIPWKLRTAEVAHFYNPAYLGRLLKEFVSSYQSEKPEGVPYELIFVAIPLIVLKFYRSALPSTIRTQLHNWIQTNSDFKIGYASIVKELLPFVKESLIFLLQRSILSINESGKLVEGPTKFNKKNAKDTEEILNTINKAKFVGKWFAKAGEATTIYALWGIRV